MVSQAETIQINWFFTSDKVYGFSQAKTILIIWFDKSSWFFIGGNNSVRLVFISRQVDCFSQAATILINWYLISVKVFVLLKAETIRIICFDLRQSSWFFKRSNKSARLFFTISRQVDCFLQAATILINCGTKADQDRQRLQLIHQITKRCPN